MGFALLLNMKVPFNKRLWSPSYNLFMCGFGTLAYAALYILCDAGIAPTVGRISRACLAPLQWLGSNCILFFIFSDSCGVLSWIIKILTWGTPHIESNLVYFW